MPRLILIDGHAMAYRQYFAFNKAPMTTSSGEPTGAVYGFARYLIDLLRQEPPVEYLAVTFDQGMSGREVEFPAYKAHRDDMETSLVVQMARIRALIQAFNIPILELPGYEADDVIGTVARLASELGAETCIVTGDRDLLQLVDERVSVEYHDTRGGVSLFDTVDKVRGKLGVRPDQVVDYKGLVGDSSDGIPGVKGVGEGTAVPLIVTYGTLEGVYANLPAVKDRFRKLLEAGRENAFLSKRLATIMRDLPVAFDLEACAAHDFDPAQVDALFAALEFNSIRKSLGTIKARGGSLAEQAAPAEAGDAAPAESPESATPASGLTPAEQVVKTIIVDTREALTALAEALNGASLIAFDTETTSLEQNAAGLVGISLSIDGQTGYYIPVGHSAPDQGTLFAGEAPAQLPLAEIITAIGPALANPRIGKSGHNAMFDLIMLRRFGFEVAPVTDDTMIAAWLARPDTRHKGLKDQARLRFGVQMTEIGALIGTGKNQISMDRVSVEQAAPYAAADAVFTHRLTGDTRAELEQLGLARLYHDLEVPLIPILASMNLVGARVDIPYLRTLSGEFATRLDEIKAQIYRSVGREFNIGSPKQLNDILFEHLHLPTGGLRASTHGRSVDAEALETLSAYHEAPRLILEWRGLEKLKNTYVDTLPAQADAEDRVHTSYNQTGAITGRLSSDSPNLQNIPIRTEEGRRVRRAFIPAPGMSLLSVDYSQIELRILAHYSQDTALLEAFHQGQDIHRATAALVKGVPLDQVTKEQRYFAKRVNFGLMYGMGAFSLAKDSGMSRSEAQTFIDQYFERLPGVRAYLDKSKVQAREQGFLETLFGRRRDFSRLRDPRLSKAEQARIEREAINMPIQGTAADIMKVAMIRLAARLNTPEPEPALRGVRMLLQVHDELVFEVPDGGVAAAANIIRGEMEAAYRLDAPLRAEANGGANWADMEGVA